MNEIYLRALDLVDLGLTNKWHSDEELYKTLTGPFRHVSMEAEEKWLRERICFRNDEVNLVICLSETNQPIGMISVREIDWISRKGHLSGIFIGQKELRDRGYGKTALKLILDHCFKDLGLNRIFAHVLEDNKPSLHVFESCGFRVEGQLRQHAYKEGRFHDVVLVGICSNEYLSLLDVGE